MFFSQSVLRTLVLLLVYLDCILQTVVLGEQFVVYQLILVGLASQNCYLLLVVILDLCKPAVVPQLTLAGLKLKLQPFVLFQQPLIFILQSIDLSIALVMALLYRFWFGLVELRVVSVVKPFVISLDNSRGTQKK